jgi:hypothetical protein
MGRHVTPFGRIIQIRSQPVFVFTPWCCVLSGEATTINFVVFGWTRPVYDSTSYHTRGEHTILYTTDVVSYYLRNKLKDRQYNDQKNNNNNIDLQNTTQKAIWTPLKTGGELRCSDRASSSWSTSDTYRINIKKSLKIPKGSSESVNRRTDSTTAKRKSKKGQAKIYKTYT